MRRRTPGVKTMDEVVPHKLRYLEEHDPARVVRLLEPLVLDRRRERLKEVIDRRVGSVSVLFDAPHDPHNGAAVLRTCEAFGVQWLHVVERKETFLAASSVARGAEKWVNVRTYKSVAPAVARLADEGMPLIGASTEGTLSPQDLRDIPRFCLVLGNERDGITTELERACTQRVRVPMRGFIESLNVSVTAAILLSHAVDGRAGDLSAEDKLRLYARGLYFSVAKADEVLAPD